MDTKSLRVLRGAAAAVSGARHLRLGRNGQDAAAVWIANEHEANEREVNDIGAIVVCDGCGSGASTEVGARLGAQLVLGAITRQLRAISVRHGRHAWHATLQSPASSGGDSAITNLNPGTVEANRVARVQPADTSALEAWDLGFWNDVRAEVVQAIQAVVSSMPGVREQIIHDYFLFTTIAAVMVDGEAVVWAIGDGAYAIDGRVRELGPFANNQPPYLAYDLLGNPQVAHFEVTRGNSVIVATDGVAEVGLDHFAGVDKFVAHPDALRRQLAIMARGNERVDWDARRIVKTPALLQDDGAVAMLVRVAEWGAS